MGVGYSPSIFLCKVNKKYAETVRQTAVFFVNLS